MNKICRICMVASKDIVPLTEQNNDGQLSETGTMFEECCTVKVNELLYYQSICMPCRMQLKYFYDFKLKALKTHEQLRKLILNYDSIIGSDEIQFINIDGDLKNDIEDYDHNTIIQEDLISSSSISPSPLPLLQHTLVTNHLDEEKINNYLVFTNDGNEEVDSDRNNNDSNANATIVQMNDEIISTLHQSDDVDLVNIENSTKNHVEDDDHDDENNIKTENNYENEVEGSMIEEYLDDADGCDSEIADLSEYSQQKPDNLSSTTIITNASTFKYFEEEGTEEIGKKFDFQVVNENEKIHDYDSSSNNYDSTSDNVINHYSDDHQSEIEYNKNCDYVDDIFAVDKMILHQLTENHPEGEIVVENEQEENEEEEEDDDDDEFEMRITKRYRHNKKSIKYYCHLCEAIFKMKDTLQAHLNVHNGLPAYSCSTCNKGFKFKNNYEYHMKNHSNNRDFKCELCDKSFLVKWDLSVHMRVHKNVRPYVCYKCGKQFRVHSHLSDHLETHSDSKKYECSYCGQKFKTKVTMKVHKDTIHERCKRFKCLQCGKDFNRLQHLKLHHRACHQIDDEIENEFSY